MYLLDSLWFYISLMVAFSLLYYGYDKKKSYELKAKELEVQLEYKRLEVEMKKLEVEMLREKEKTTSKI